jgi:hypothetical protein
MKVLPMSMPGVLPMSVPAAHPQPSPPGLPRGEILGRRGAGRGGRICIFIP